MEESDDVPDGKVSPAWASSIHLNVFLGFLLVCASLTLNSVVQAQPASADPLPENKSVAAGPGQPADFAGNPIPGAPAVPPAASNAPATLGPYEATRVWPGTVTFTWSGPTVDFGMDARSLDDQTRAGLRPDYATLWVGPWTLTNGWNGPDAQLEALRAAGVTPAIHFYYWGDDISPQCLETGCWSTKHNHFKHQAGWQQLAQELVDHLNAHLGGEPVLILLETEFNKASVATYEPLDAYLTQKAAFLRQGYPSAKIVMALGNWHNAAWSTWDLTAAASDYIGLQAMRGHSRDSADRYLSAYDATLEGARAAQRLFGKPIVIHDMAFSSMAGSDSAQWQREALLRFFVGLPNLKAAGVEALIYRSWNDSPTAGTAEYYGDAERYLGLVDATSWTQKPAAEVWARGLAAERSGMVLTYP